MAFKIVVSQKAETHQMEVDDTKALNGLVIGDEFDGAIVGLDGYTLKITGGSDKNGFTMKKRCFWYQKNQKFINWRYRLSS